MANFYYKEVTSNCFKQAIKDLTDAQSLYDQQQNVLCEEKVAKVIYKVTSVLQLINLEKEMGEETNSSRSSSEPSHSFHISIQ